MNGIIRRKLSLLCWGRLKYNSFVKTVTEFDFDKVLKNL